MLLIAHAACAQVPPPAVSLPPGVISTAQQTPPGAIPEDVSPRLLPGLPKPGIASQQAAARPSLWKTLQDHGVQVRLLYLDQFLANPSAGLEPGNTSNTGVLSVGADLNMDKLVGIPGGYFHVLESVMMFKSNTTMNKDLGGGIAGLEYITVPVSNTLSVATYEQRLLEKRLDIEFGRSNEQRYFGLPNCDNITSCQSSIIAYDAGVPPPRFANWMIRGSYNFTPAVYVQAAAFEQLFKNDRTEGFHFGIDGDTGVLAIGELGYETDFKTAVYPGRFEFGGYDNMSPHSDPYYTNEFQPIPSDRQGTPLKHANNQGVLLFGEQVLWRQDGGHGNAPYPSHLTMYGQFLHDFSSTEPYAYDAALGLTYTGFIPSAPADRVGIKFRTLTLTDSELKFQEAAHVAAGGPNVALSPEQYDVELNGHFLLTRTVAFEPTVQYLIHPDSFLNPYTRSAPQSGFFLGGNVVIYLGQLLGAPPPTD